MPDRLVWLSWARGRLEEFLADAHKHHGVLRQVGANYQFRHLQLQHRLASHHELPSPGWPVRELIDWLTHDAKNTRARRDTSNSHEHS